VASDNTFNASAMVRIGDTRYISSLVDSGYYFNFRERTIMNNNESNWRIALQAEKVAQWQIAANEWQDFALVAWQENLRWAAGWAEQVEEQFIVNACFEKQGKYLWLRTKVETNKAELPSQATIYPAASRSERYTQDMFGIKFSEHPDSRHWLRHKAWAKYDHPLCKDFPVEGSPEAVTLPDTNYQFVKARGVGVYEIPVGPVHAGIIEPGHFRFQAVGEMILNLEERLGYVHKGIEKIAEGRTPDELLRLAGRISGDSTIAHSWAACRAMEQAAGITIPPRAAFIRGILCERERIANHLGDIGAVSNDVGFSFAQMQFSRLREQWQRSQAKIFGHRLMMDCLVVGGVKNDLSEANVLAISAEIVDLQREIEYVMPALDLNSSLEDRLQTTGYLSESTAAAFGTLGYVGRASGQDFDVRRDAPYAPYDQLNFQVPVEHEGDIAARVLLRVKEVSISIELISQMLKQLPDGEVQTPWQVPAKDSENLAMIEGWRGEIISYVRFGSDNKISRFYARDPSCLNWPALEKIALNNIVPDFPVCNKSVNCSYSGTDL